MRIGISGATDLWLFSNCLWFWFFEKNLKWKKYLQFQFSWKFSRKSNFSSGFSKENSKNWRVSWRISKESMVLDMFFDSFIDFLVIFQWKICSIVHNFSAVLGNNMKPTWSTLTHWGLYYNTKSGKMFGRS